MKRRILSLLLVAVMLAGLLGGCGQETAKTTETPKPSESVQPSETVSATPSASPEATTTGLGPDMLLLPTMENMGDKWPGSWDNYGLLGRMMIFSRLIRLDADLKPAKGDLAESWTASPDGLQYVFTLRKGVKWHDGKDFTADDVAFSIKTALKAAQVNGVMKNAMRNIKGAEEYIADKAKTAADEIEGIKVNDNVITFDMAKPCGTFLLAMGQFNIFPRHKIEGLDPLTLNSSTFYDWPIGTGPYKIKEFVPNDYALLEVNEDYFGAKPTIKQVKFTQMTQKDYATRALANEIDYFSTNDLATAQAAIQNPNYKAFFTDIYFVRYLQWNSKGPKADGNDPFKDIRTRRAIAHAIDREAIVKSLFPGQAAVTNAKVPTSFPYYNKDVYDLKYDPTLAKKLLDEAGFDYNTTVKFAAYYSDQGTADLMDSICAYLAEIGVKAEWHLLTGDITSQIWDVRDYNFLYAGLSAMAVEEAYNLWYSKSLKDSMYGKVYPTDFTGLDKLLEDLWVATDTAKHDEIVKQIQKVDSEQMLWNLPLFSLKNIQVFNTARVNLPSELKLSNEWSNYERFIEKWTLNPAK